MSPPAASPKILYRNSRLLRMVFLQLHRQQRADLFCDVVLQAEGQAVPAHCCILSACSPFFTERLEREMPPKGHKVVLEIRGLKIGTLRKLVDFLYTSEMEVSREEAQDIIAAARQLQVSELESLQLEGGKLVKRSLGPRLNRNCLQLSSPVFSPEASLMQSPAVSDGSSLTSLVVARKQRAAAKLPCTKDSNNGAGQKETKKQKPVAAILNCDKQQMPKGPTVPTDPLRIKGKKRAASMLRNTSGNDEVDNSQTEETGSGEKQEAVSSQEAKKIKISRSKLSTRLSPTPCTTKNHSTTASSKSSMSARRLWRQKIPPSKDGTKEGEDTCHSEGFRSPSLVPKTAKGRKRNVSEPAASSNLPPEAGQIGRVKLRKVVNGSCWEVVQESFTEPTGGANTVYVLQDKDPQPQPHFPKAERVDAQESASSPKLPAKQKASPYSEKNLVEEHKSKEVLGEADSGVVTSYELSVFELEHLTEDEQYGSVASNGELEHMLDLLLADDDSPGDSQGTTIPGSVNVSGLALGEKKSPLEIAGNEEKDRSSTDTSVCQPLVKSEDRPLKTEQEASNLEIDEETHGSVNGLLLTNPVLDSLPLVAAEPGHDSSALCKAASLPELDDWTVPGHQLTALENDTGRFSEALAVVSAGNKDQGLLPHGVGISASSKRCIEAQLPIPP
ncbi:BTB/POZ domain-containing protein 18 isoform X2 [Anolis carolinensis]|uniref:BTB/POZ domain-containing protein 18 isoform X2 n=1 Tax=Anolis carolinensis TaxID=28377 RepID=UPI0004626D1C|nr:PREDICTED: BTB/POZ domain-containing protein 18 isoform X2 [Anolis carolinensis]|eukprot:XP_008109138.1 PREDICTED: BTB/POZ domain-containing protein 18 isoform X2 [Anolis carolinensis]